MKDDRLYIEHILLSIERIESYITGENHQSFSDDYLTQDAVVRQLEIIGEATKRISKEFRSINPQVPWSDMAGMRDVLIHDYLAITKPNLDKMNLVWYDYGARFYDSKAVR